MDMLDDFIVIRVRGGRDRVLRELSLLENVDVVKSFDGFMRKVIREGSIDELTGVYSKSYFLRFIRRNRFCEGVVCMFDIDDFKLINERYGHIRADNFLRKVVDIFRKSIRRSDILFRFGGDEFIIFFGGLGYGDASRILLRIEERLELSWEVIGVRVSISYGFSEVSRGVSFMDALEIADKNMLKCKRVKKYILNNYDK